MNDETIRIACLVVAAIIMPALYVALCIWLYRRRAWWFAYCVYFVLCGSIGGWAFALTFRMCTVGFICLYTVAPVCCLLSALVLRFRKNKSRPEEIAMLGGYAYFAGLALVWFAIACMER